MGKTVRQECNLLAGQLTAQIREMKRLWIGKELDGLIKRREPGAQLALQHEPRWQRIQRVAGLSQWAVGRANSRR